jgi:hypothetical protein
VLKIAVPQAEYDEYLQLLRNYNDLAAEQDLTPLRSVPRENL